MVNVRAVRVELTAIGRAAGWLAWRFLDERGRFDSTAPHPTPVLFAHGFFGDRTNFRGIARALAGRGVRNVAYFEYGPRIDWPRLATRLGDAVDRVRAETGARRVDVVGHSLGGLVARHLVEVRPGAPVRRLVTLGSPYFGSPLPRNELAVFGSSDPLVPSPHPEHGPHAPESRVIVIPDCGHWGLLVHDRVANELTRFLTSPDLSLTHGERSFAFDAAS